ncbi:MAG: Na+/H+ antiporter NhaC family protein, partial [Burkholderiaceae bacterium]
SSVSNPIPLSIAQPLVGLQIFSGAGFRFLSYLVFLVVGIVFVLLMIRREGHDSALDREFDARRLSPRHLLVLWVVAVGIALLVYGSNRWHWTHHDLSAYYVAMSIVIAISGGLGASEAADAFVSGMKKVLMASMLIGVASAVAVVLEQGQVLDSIVHTLTQLIGENGPWPAAIGMFGAQLFLDFLIPSTSGQAAVSMPIMGPLGQLSGVGPQTTVLAYILGNGITNLLTPTSGTLLAYLATAQVSWIDWARAVFWLWVAFIAVAIALLSIAVMIGY